MKVKAGDILTFRGCAWSDGWEFDAPCVLYRPVKRYGCCGSISALSIDRMVEDVCIDLALDGEVRDGWGEGDLKEFRWRGWSPNGFSRRRSAVHAEFVVKFADRRGADGLEWEYVAAAEIDVRSGARKPVFEGVPSAAEVFR